MKKISLLVGLLVIVAMLSGCMVFDHTTDRYENDNNSRGGSFNGHSHH